MAIVKEFKKQDTTYIFHDDFCITDPDEIKRILEKIAKEALPKIKNVKPKKETA
ncbi:MAG: hypothetical protein KH366_10695 [Clostridiaceae bacterium]|nr:hypothetical protein [Clostridiaceae bacterium]